MYTFIVQGGAAGLGEFESCVSGNSSNICGLSVF